MKAMILAAGFGTRLKPFTDVHPKALAVVNNKSLLQRNIEWLQTFGIKKVIVNVCHFAEQIIEAVNKNNGWGSEITISDESGTILETGGGLQKASWFFENENEFVLMNADVLTSLDLNEMIHQQKQKNILATLAVSNRKTSRYFLFDDENLLCGWKNTQTNEIKLQKNATAIYEKAFSGIHVIQSKIFSLMQQQGKFSMVEVYLSLCASQKILAYDHSGTKFIDVGKPESLEIAANFFQ